MRRISLLFLAVAVAAAPLAAQQPRALTADRLTYAFDLDRELLLGIVESVEAISEG